MPRLCNLERTRGFFRLCFFFFVFFSSSSFGRYSFSYIWIFVCVCVSLSVLTFLSLVLFSSVCRCVSQSVRLSICLSRSPFPFRHYLRFHLPQVLPGPSLLSDPRVSVHVSRSGESAVKSWAAPWRPAGGLSYSGKFAAHATGMPFCLWLGFSCLLLYMYTHMHLLSLPLSLFLSLSLHTHTHTHGPYVPASPVTGPQYRSIIYLRPLTLWIRSRFSPIMAGLAQHPASIKAYPEMSPTHTHAQVRIMWSHSHPDVVTQTAKMARALLKKTHTHTHTCWI